MIGHSIHCFNRIPNNEEHFNESVNAGTSQELPGSQKLGARCCLGGQPAATEVESGATTTTRPAAEARQNIAEDKIAKK